MMLLAYVLCKSMTGILRKMPSTSSITSFEKFPFRIQQMRTDRGHEFQAQFHWHVEDLGIRHVYIKARTPQLNGKVERSHRSDSK